MSGTVEVSAARPEEYAALGRIVVAAYRSVGAIFDDDYAAYVADVARRATAPGVVVLAARDGDGAAIGCATVVLGGGEYAEGELRPGLAVLRMVGVDSRARGRGAGRALVTTAIELAKQHGCTAMALYSQPMMHVAHGMYESLGFVRRPDRDWHPVNEVQLLGYELRL